MIVQESGGASLEMRRSLNKAALGALRQELKFDSAQIALGLLIHSQTAC